MIMPSAREKSGAPSDVLPVGTDDKPAAGKKAGAGDESAAGDMNEDTKAGAPFHPGGVERNQ
jgi:hypothetical protein